MKRSILSLLCMICGTSVVVAQMEMDEDIRDSLLAKSDSLYNIGVDLYSAGEYWEAIPIFTECDSIDNMLIDKRTGHPSWWLASCYYQLGDTIKANEIDDYCIYSPVDRRLTVRCDSLTEMGWRYLENEDFEHALICFKQCPEIAKTIVGEEHVWYERTLERMAWAQESAALRKVLMGNYDEAIRYVKENLYIYERVYGKESTFYASSLSTLATYYHDLGYDAEAIRLEKEALKIRKRFRGEYPALYATSLSELARYNSSYGNDSVSIKFGTEALNAYKKVYGNVHPAYAMALSDLANYNARLGNYFEAISLETEALNICEMVYGKEHLHYAISLSNLANFNSSLGNNSEAISLETEALNILEKIYGEDHAFCATSLSNLAFYSFLNNDSKSTTNYVARASETRTNLIERAFADITATQRAMFWGKHSNWYERVIHSYSYYIPSDTLTLNGYNGVLLSKGLLLNSDIEFSKLIQGSGDSEIITMYDDLKTLRLQINKLIETPIAERFANVDSLERIAQAKESALIERSKVYGDYTANLVITWEQVQERLTEKDIAVEFVSFPLNADRTMYIAYTLRKGWEYPRMIPLFEEKQLKKMYSDEYYTTTDISELVWQPLEEVLEGVKTVYFAPSGELYNIAIESVPDYATNGKTIVSDSRTYFRLSSTRELALKKDKDVWKEAAVYGGLKYGMTAEGLTADSRSFNPNNKIGSTIVNDIYNIADTLSTMRGGALAEQLPGTLIEAEAIDKSLEASGVSSTMFIDSIGTEASFKNLNGKKTSIMHIGTHGFYWTEKEAKTYNYKFLMNDKTSGKYVEDKQLTRSGLLFAGANYVLSGSENQLPEGVDDGILTAEELTTIDLRGLDMVVLSACQTGLGEITGDGVFGLQRGFKKAGAQTIVMSLWKVNDEATRLFMTKFFEEIRLDKDGHPTNKHEAFLSAQRYLRDEYEIEQTRTINSNLTASQRRRLEREGKSVEVQTITEKVKPYAAPKYWAAFIMLGGIL